MIHESADLCERAVTQERPELRERATLPDSHVLQERATLADHPENTERTLHNGAISDIMVWCNLTKIGDTT